MAKQRARRGEPPLPAATVVIRGDLLDPEILAEFTAGDLQLAGLDLWDTGGAPHYDVVHADLAELVARMLGTVHRVVLNPHHHTGG